jgi:hypothetical protein
MLFSVKSLLNGALQSLLFSEDIDGVVFSFSSVLGSGKIARVDKKSVTDFLSLT